VADAGAEGIEKDPEAVNDGEEPTSSSDPASYFDWWPEKGKTEWIEYDFPKVSKVSQVKVYWFDDTGRGGGVFPRPGAFSMKTAGRGSRLKAPARGVSRRTSTTWWRSNR
jgi:hypothetical protein